MKNLDELKLVKLSECEQSSIIIMVGVLGGFLLPSVCE